MGARMVNIHLVQSAADWAMAPFFSTEINQFLSQLSIGSLSHVIVDARKLFAKKALLATLAPKRAAAGFVLGSIKRLVRSDGM